jgi:hypothetical protein
MQDTLNAKIADLHVFLYGGLRSLPFSLGGTMLLLGLFTSNYAILFFLIGLLIIAPVGSWIINRLVPLMWFCLRYIWYGIRYLFNGGGEGIKDSIPQDPLNIEAFKTSVDDVCKIIIPFGKSKNSNNSDNGTKETVISSEWMAMSSFFIGYAVCNALQLYKNDMTGSAAINSPDAPDTENKVNKRKSQAMFALVSITIFALVVLIFRWNTGCEPAISIFDYNIRFGLLFTGPLFGIIGYYWYQLLSIVGQGRLSDIFGIANRLLAPSAIKNGPIACVPIPAR